MTVLSDFIDSVEEGMKTPFPENLKKEWLKIEKDQLKSAYKHSYSRAMSDIPMETGFEEFLEWIENSE